MGDREVTVSVNFKDIETLENINSWANELEIDLDDLVSLAVKRMVRDIEEIKELWCVPLYKRLQKQNKQ